MDDFGCFGNYGHNSNYYLSYNHLEDLSYERGFRTNVFNIIKDKPNLSGLLEVRKVAQGEITLNYTSQSK